MKSHVLICCMIAAFGLSLSGCKSAALNAGTATGKQQQNFVSSWELYNIPTANANPRVYSFDGKTYQPDAELFAGSFFKKAEHPDWQNLPNIRETKGVYRIKVANEHPDIQQVDQLQLLVVDHPKGSQVYPSAKGQLYTINHPKAPQRAFDFAGTDVRNRIVSPDQDYWLSNPLNRDPRQKDQLRDGLILEFDRPDEAISAVLLLQVQNTYWAAEFQNDLLDLPGRDLPRWFEQLNNNAEARNDLLRARIRENALRIYIWDGSQWRPSGYVNETGASTLRTGVEEIDLMDIPGSHLKIKLECPPGTWMINSAQVDYAYYTIPTVAQQVMPAKALDQNGRDARIMLEKADNRYWEMKVAGDVLFVEFDAPAKVAGTERTVILKSVGYYTPKREGSGEPQLERLRLLLNEPGMLGQFNLESLQKKVARLSKSAPLVQ